MSPDEKQAWLEILRHDDPLDREMRDRLADILEEYFRREDGKPGRPRLTPATKGMQTDQLMRRWELVEAEIKAGRSYTEATKIVAKRERISLSSFRKRLPEYALYLWEPADRMPARVRAHLRRAMEMAHRRRSAR